MKTTTKNMADFLNDDAACWEYAARFFDELARTPAEVSAGNDSLWHLQSAIYRERASLCKSLLADLGTHDGGPA